MATSEGPTPAAARQLAPKIGISRVLGAGAASAIGLAVGASLAIFIAGNELFALLGEESPGAFLLAMVLLLPLILALVEAGDRNRSGASLYSLSREHGDGRIAFFVGWLAIGGYLAVATLLVAAIVTRLQLFLERVFFLEVETLGIVIFVVAVSAIHELVGSRGWWRGRTTLILGAIVLLAALVTAGFFREAKGIAPALEPGDVDNWLSGVALLAAVLWALDLVLDHRSLFRRPRRTAKQGLLTTWIVANVLGAMSVYLVTVHPDLLVRSLSAELSFDEHRLQLLYALVAIVLCGGGLFRVLSVSLRLVRLMAMDGFFPATIWTDRTKRGVPFRPIVTFGAIIGAAAWSTPIRPLLSFAALAALWAAVLVLFPFSRRRPEPISGALRLPLHPLAPGLGIGTAAYLSVLLPDGAVLVGWAWLALGLLFYLAFARKGRIAVEKRDLVLGEEPLPGTDDTPRTLVAIGDGEEMTSLVRIAAAYAESGGRELLVLKVLPLQEQASRHEQRVEAERELRAVEEVIAAVGLEEAAVRPLVRIAPTAADGILSALTEEKVDLLLIGSSDEPKGEETQREGTTDRVFPATSRAMAIVHGRLEHSPRRVLVATAGGPHAPTALEVGAALAGPEGVVTLLAVDTPRSTTDGEETIRATIERATRSGPVETKVVKATDARETIIAVAADHDLVLLGASTDQLLNLNVLAGFATEVAESLDVPAIIVKRAERARLFWRRRVWEYLARLFPTVTVRERTEVFSDMRQLARATVDFYVLISLAAVIAALGLLLDSGAVIIGAMLVAPLMSPILSMAHGIVQGNLIMLRRGAVSTARGTAVAIAISTAFGVLFAGDNATEQMLARSYPNLLDLLVALAAGAAAAYAMSRKSVSAALPGVAISVALVPPLCVVGLGLGMGSFRLAGGALLLYLTNLAGIVLVAATVFLILGFRPARAERGERVRLAIVWAIIALFVISIPLAFQTRANLRIGRLESLLNRKLSSLDESTFDVVDYRLQWDGERFVVDLITVAYTHLEQQRQRVAEIQSSIQEGISAPVQVRVILLEGALIEAESGESDVIEPEPSATVGEEGRE